MKRAILLAKKASGMTSPNPMVGAVIVKEGKIIASAFHKMAGEPHAEALAIERAGRRAKGSTLYVSLEPCCHIHKRTPPCTKTIINSGIKRVVVAMLDLNPMVSGKGIDELKRAGIKVTVGILEKQARALNEAYIKYITTGLPFVIMKVAMTLDGKIATPEGQSKWITGKRARALVHKLRSRSDAVLTAIGTVKADDPLLTSRGSGRISKQPLRVVIDPELEIPFNAKVLKTPPETIIITKKKDKKAEQLESSGIHIIQYRGKLKLKWLLQRLAERSVISVMVEGGSSLNAHCLTEGIVDKVMFFIAPKIIGGKESFPAVGGRTFRRLKQAYRLKDIRVRRIGEDVLFEGYIF